MTQPVAFVTGASTGIGFETAWKLAARGFTVYAGARRVEKMEPLKAHGREGRGAGRHGRGIHEPPPSSR